MKFEFYKYEATGNDMIIIDNLSRDFPKKGDIIRLLCNRHKGLGGDGLILLEGSLENNNIIMCFYNPDGSEASMCGNGGRCFASYIYSKYCLSDILFKAGDGFHRAYVDYKKGRNYNVKLSMNEVKGIVKDGDSFILNTGVPHYVSFVDDLELSSFIEESRQIRYSNKFMPEGINVDFAKYENGVLFLRTYERGVEWETLSCGTGVVAAAVSSYYIDSGFGSDIIRKVITKGGELTVSYNVKNDVFDNIFLEGEVNFVFSGVIEI